MPCIHVELAGGAHAIVKVAAARRGRCTACHELTDHVCDAPAALRSSGTCDVRICPKHTYKHTVDGKDLEYCPFHHNLAHAPCVICKAQPCERGIGIIRRHCRNPRQYAICTRCWLCAHANRLVDHRGHLRGDGAGFLQLLYKQGKLPALVQG